MKDNESTVNPNSVDSASLTPSIRKIIAEEIAAAADSSDDDVDASLVVESEEDDQIIPSGRGEVAYDDIQEEAEFGQSSMEETGILDSAPAIDQIPYQVCNRKVDQSCPEAHILIYPVEQHRKQRLLHASG